MTYSSDQRAVAVPPSAMSDAPEKPRRARTSGIDRALQILDHLQTTDRPATAYEIARSVGAPVSTIYVIIDDLVEKQLLMRVGGSMVWLGSRLLHYGLAYARSLDLLTVATEVMNELAHAVGETVQVCGRDEGSMVVLAMADGPGHFRVSSRLGTRVPLNWTASGRLLVGHLPREERIAVFNRCAMASPTGRATTDAATLADAAAEALAQRLSIQIGESDFAVACVAAPIQDRDGACVASISIVLPEEKVRTNSARYTHAVQEAAQQIEKRLGHRAQE